jgi:seryl-tRNA synthetase
MKRIFAFVICAVLLLCVCPVVSFAEGEAVVQEPTLTDQIIRYAKEHIEEIAVIVYIFITSIYERKKQKANFNAIATVNNNAVTVSTDSKTAIDNANQTMQEVKAEVVGYKESMDKLLDEFAVIAEEKKRLEAKLDEVNNHLKTSKLANMELANEVAELLVLANIPNSKKEELYSRHLAAVGAIAEAEKTEVIINEDGQEAE